MSRPHLFKKGDLVACYVTNTDQWQSLMSWGIVLDINPDLDDILVLDNQSNRQWWPSHRWKIISNNESKRVLDNDIKMA